MKNYDSRLQNLESKIKLRTSLLKVYSENSLGKLDLISEQFISPIKKYLVKIIFGHGIFPEKNDK